MLDDYLSLAVSSPSGVSSSPPKRQKSCSICVHLPGQLGLGSLGDDNPTTLGEQACTQVRHEPLMCDVGHSILVWLTLVCPFPHSGTMTQRERPVAQRDGPGIVLDHASYSSLSNYLRCGKAYELTRILGLVEQPAWWSIGGNAVHSATEDLDRRRFEERGL